MTRDEFEQTVRKMQDENVPLTMANLLVRTELPRSQIEAWLDDVQRDVKIARPKKSEPPPRTNGDATTADDSGKSKGLVDRAKALRGEIVGDAIKSQLGLGPDRNAERGITKQRRGVRAGGVLGLVLPPAGLLYSAPYPVAGLGAVAYIALAWLALHLPFGIGIPYLLIPLHILGGLGGAAYAWRFNRKGKRAKLLPGK